MNKKICASCNISKDLSEFHKRTKSKDGRQSRCKDCNKSQRKDYYKSAHGRAVEEASGKRWSHQIRLRVIEYLKSHPCIDCGEDDIVVLEFDHVRGVKEFNIAHMMQNAFGWERIQAEIAKCDVRCANCHKRKTAKQFGWLKLEIL